MTAFTVTIAAGSSSGSAPFTLTPIDDTLAEGDETISVNGAADNGLTVNGTHLTLVDDDVVINLSVTPARVAEDAGATSVTLTAAFSPVTTYDTATTVTVTVGAAGDSATEGVDYQAVANFTVTIAAGASSGSVPFTLTPIDDTLVEGDETITVAGTADRGLTVNGTSVTLVDDDVVIDLSVNPARVAEDAGATSVTLTAAFSPVTTYDTDTTVTVTVGAAGDSATEGVDYQAVANFTVTIRAGASSGSTPFTLTPIDDTLVEDDETISVNGTADRGLTVNGTRLTLTDDDATAEAVSDDASDDFATVTVSNARALEGEPMTFTLTLDKATTGSFTVTPMYQRWHRHGGRRLHPQPQPGGLCRTGRRAAHLHGCHPQGQTGGTRRDLRRQPAHRRAERHPRAQRQRHHRQPRRGDRGGGGAGCRRGPADHPARSGRPSGDDGAGVGQRLHLFHRHDLHRAGR